MLISLFEPHSIYASRLAREGKLLTHHTDRSVLTLMSLESVIDHDYTPVTTDMLLGRVIHVISQSPSEFIPVLDNAGKLLGEVDVTKIRHIIFRTELYGKFTVAQLMTPSPTRLVISDPMEDVMRKFEKTNVNSLPVVDVSGILVGFVSRSRVYSMYRKMVADFSSE